MIQKFILNRDLKRLLRLHRVSQTELARKLNISRQAISEILHNKYNLSEEAFFRILRKGFGYSREQAVRALFAPLRSKFSKN